MADFDLKSNTKAVTSVAPAVRTADVNGAGVDTLDWGSATIASYVGAGGITFDGTNYFDFIIQESDDNSAWNAVPTEDLILGAGQQVFGAANSGIVRRFQAAKAAADVGPELYGYRGKKRYVRGIYDFTGTHSTGTLVGADVILSHAYHKPTWAASVET